jgi:acyl-CoA thioesterase II
LRDLALDTALAPLASPASPAAYSGEVRCFGAELSRDWEIWGPNGGYLAALALRAAGACASIPRPASFYAHFLSVARFGPVEIRVRELRRGRRAEAFAVTIAQDDRAVVEAMVRTASEGPGLMHDVARMPDVPPPDALRSFAELLPDGEPGYPFWRNFESKPADPESYTGDPKPHPPSVQQWHRFVPRESFDEPFLDTGRLLILLDTMGWPAGARAHPNAPFQAPSLDVAAWFHRPAAGERWLLSDHTAAVAEQGLIGATGRIWSARGQLLASGGSQLLCVPVTRA